MIFLIVESFHTERLYWPIVREMGETAIENEQNLLLCWEKAAIMFCWRMPTRSNWRMFWVEQINRSSEPTLSFFVCFSSVSWTQCETGGYHLFANND